MVFDIARIFFLPDLSILMVEKVSSQRTLTNNTMCIYPELCLVQPFPGALVHGAQRLPSIVRSVESMFLVVQLRDRINYPVPANKVLSASIMFYTQRRELWCRRFFLLCCLGMT